jgi:hypothetical protein
MIQKEYVALALPIRDITFKLLIRIVKIKCLVLQIREANTKNWECLL